MTKTYFTNMFYVIIFMYSIDCEETSSQIPMFELGLCYSVYLAKRLNGRIKRSFKV